jgi:hypothetical protein
MRMPTRFTDVTFADGTKKNGVSEETMIKDFCISSEYSV